MTKEQEAALRAIEQRNEFAFSCLPQEWQAVPLKKQEPIWFPFYDLDGMLNLAIVQPDGEITREVRA